MKTATRQANFLLPEDLFEDLKRHVAAREQSRFVVTALKKELKRLELKKAVDACFGAWKDKDHPELKQGAGAFVRRMRRSSRLKGSL